MGGACAAVRDEPEKQKLRSCRAQELARAVPRKMRGRKRWRTGLGADRARWRTFRAQLRREFDSAESPRMVLWYFEARTELVDEF